MPLSRLWASGDVIWSITIQLCILIVSLFSTLHCSFSQLLSSNLGLTLLLSLVWMYSVSLERVISCPMPFPILLSHMALWMLTGPVYWMIFPLWHQNLLRLFGYTKGQALTPPWLPCYRGLPLMMLSFFLHYTQIIFALLLPKSRHLITCFS